MKILDKKINRTLTIEDAEHLSSHEISDIIGNYSKEDFCTGKKYYNNFSSIHYFTISKI